MPWNCRTAVILSLWLSLIFSSVFVNAETKVVISDGHTTIRSSNVVTPVVSSLVGFAVLVAIIVLICRYCFGMCGGNRRYGGRIIVQQQTTTVTPPPPAPAPAPAPPPTIVNVVNNQSTQPSMPMPPQQHVVHHHVTHGVGENYGFPTNYGAPPPPPYNPGASAPPPPSQQYHQQYAPQYSQPPKY